MKTIALMISFFFSVIAFAAPQNLGGLYVNTFGDPTDQALFFVHGGPGFNSHDFEVTTAQKLSDEGFFVVVYDQRGQGRSDEAKESDFNYATYSYDIKFLIDNLKISSPVIVGHSHGGPIAINFEKNYPGVAKAIILVSAPVNFWGSMRSIFENCSRNYLKLSNHEALQNLTYEYYELFLNPNSKFQKSFLVGSSFIHGVRCGLYDVSSPTTESQALRRVIQENPIQSTLAGTRTAMPGFLKNESYVEKNYTDFLLNNQGRFFGIYGDEDGLFTPLELSMIKLALQGDNIAKRYQLIKGSSHSIFIDQQAQFIKMIKAFAK